MGIVAQARHHDQAEERGSEISFGLSIQLVLERLHRDVWSKLQSVAHDLHVAGESQAEVAARVFGWYKALTTAANSQMTPEQFQEILVQVGMLAADIRRANSKRRLIINFIYASQ